MGAKNVRIKEVHVAKWRNASAVMWSKACFKCCATVVSNSMQMKKKVLFANLPSVRMMQA